MKTRVVTYVGIAVLVFLILLALRTTMNEWIHTYEPLPDSLLICGATAFAGGVLTWAAFSPHSKDRAANQARRGTRTHEAASFISDRSIRTHPVTPAVLSSVKCRVSPSDEAVPFRALVGEDCDTETGRDWPVFDGGRFNRQP